MSESVLEREPRLCAAPYCLCVISTGTCAARDAVLKYADDVWDRTALACGLPSLVGWRDESR